LLKTFGGDTPYCLSLDDVTMFTQSQYDLYVKLTKFGVHYEIDVHRGDIGNSVYKKTMVLYLDI